MLPSAARQKERSIHSIQPPLMLPRTSSITAGSWRSHGNCGPGAVIWAAVLLPFAAAAPRARGQPPWAGCEMRDGDCPSCPTLGRSLSPVAKISLSSNSELVASAEAADELISAAGSTGTGGDIISFDNPATGLHTSMFYFCCHSAEELFRMHEVFANLSWAGFTVSYDTAGCNVDTHDNRTVYLHAMPANQTALFQWAAVVEAALTAAGVPVNHPRRSLFHMTLARVTRAFPANATVAELKDEAKMRPHGTFGTALVCEFEFGGRLYQADRIRPPCDKAVPTDSQLTNPL